MVAYGPWTQEPDYEGIRSDPAPGGEAGASVQVGHWLEGRSMPPGTWAPAFPLVGQAMNAASQNNDGGSLSVPNAGATAIARYYVGGGGNPQVDPWVSEGEAWHHFRLRSFAPHYVTGYYFFPDLPPGAVGIEWLDGSDPTQGHRATPLAGVLSADSVLRGHIEEQPGNYVPSFTTEILAASSGSVIYPTGVPEFHSWTGPGADASVASITSAGAALGSNARTLGADLDLTSLLDAEGRVALYTKTPEAAIQGTDNQGSGFTMQISYGWWIDTLVMRWTFRPPVYRFAYAEEPYIVTPPRRIFPRDDGLTGGARRTWPPSKGYQYGNRVDGSGYL